MATHGFDTRAKTKRKTTFSTPTARKKYKSSFVETAVKSIRDRHYDAAFRLLVRKSARAKRMMITVVSSLIKSEIKKSNHGGQTTFSATLTTDFTQQFSWDTVVSELHNTFPLLFAFVKSAIQTRSRHVEVNGKYIGDLLPGCGVAIAVLLNLNNPARYTFFQQLISVVMFRSGCSKKFVKWMHKLGFCLGYDATRRLIDRLASSFDSKIMQWRNNLQVDHGVFDNDSAEETETSSTSVDSRSTNGSSSDVKSLDIDNRTESTDIYCQSTDVSDASDDEDTSAETMDSEDAITKQKELLEPGYALCWDNVQKLSTARHQSTVSKNKMLLWANAYSVRNRISFRDLELVDDKCTPSSIPLHKLLPSEEDLLDIHARMEVLVERILVTNVDELTGTPTVDHIQHKYSEESQNKSEIINLGVIKEDPSSTKGVIQIMKNLNKYIPKVKGQVLEPIICHGDQLSVERMLNAKLSMASSETSVHRMEGLYPRPQNFHKRVIVLQDTMDMLLTNSTAQIGTLMNIKNRFGHRNVRHKVSDCTNHAVDFLNFVTEGYLLLLYDHLLGDATVPTDEGDRHQFLSMIARRIVRFVLPQFDMRQSLAEINGEDGSDKYCVCESSADVQSNMMIECSSGKSCPHGRWFHDVCVNFPDNEGDWWCSDACKVKGVSSYCCKRITDEILIRCTATDNCISGEFFHPSCIGLAPSVGTYWYCSDRCRCEHLKMGVDHIQEYSKAVVWRGLLHMVETDCERENDGTMMMTMWRWNILEFWEYNHYKYLILAHRLLTAVNGWASARISQELIWNATANLKGHPGKNLALDLVNEFLNNEFKENLKACHGQYTDKTVERRSRVVGTIGKSIEDCFSQHVVRSYNPLSKTIVSHKLDIHKLKQLYRKEKLFECILGRKHKSFQNFYNTIRVKDPEKLRKRLNHYANELEMEESLYL